MCEVSASHDATTSGDGVDAPLLVPCKWYYCASVFVHRNPTPRNATGVSDADVHDVGVTWPAARPGSELYLEIGDELAVKKDLLDKRMDFWDRVFLDTTHAPLYDFCDSHQK